MLKVQKELVALKQKANEEELKSLQEAKLKALEQQIRDIRVGCMKIRGECDKQEKVIGELKERKMELDDDRKFLDFEIRDCRLQNQNLKVTISKTHNKCDELNATKDELNQKYASEVVNQSGTTGKTSTPPLLQQSSILHQNAAEVMQDKRYTE